MSSTFLTPDEIAELTGRKHKARQIEALRKMGLPFWVNAIGRPIVSRVVIEGKPAAAPAKKEPWVPAVLLKKEDG